MLQQKFTEGSSLTAYELNDLTWLGTNNIPQSQSHHHMHTAVPFTFGCQVAETGMIQSQVADGILGLSMHSSSSGGNTATSLISVMYEEGSIEFHAFSLCFKRNGGFMSIGGVQYSSGVMKEQTVGRDDGSSRGGGMHHLKESLQFERLRQMQDGKKQGYYSIHIKSVRINNVSLPLPEIYQFFSEGKGTVVDSGTSDTYLPMGIAKVFREVWIKVQNTNDGAGAGAGSKHNNRVEMYTFEQFKNLPDVTLTLSGGYEWVIRPSAYMEISDEETIKSSSSKQKWKIRVEDDNVVDEFIDGWIDGKKLANRIYLDEPIGCVLGANAMFEHDVLFDIGGQRIGIASADCTYRGGEAG